MFTFKKDVQETPEAASRRCDAKWVAGILAAACLAAGLALGVAAKLTDERAGTDVITYLFAVIASPKGIDDPADIDGLRQMLAAKGGAETTPFPGMAIRVKESDINGMSPREVRLFLFRQVAEPLWQGGEDGLSRVFDDETLRSQAKDKGIGALGYVTHAVHDRLKGWSDMAMIMSAVFVFAAMMASRGFGRLVTPGVAYLSGGLPVSLAAWKLRDIVDGLALMAASPGANPFGYVAHVLGIALKPHVASIEGPAGVGAAAGILLLTAAFAGNGAVFVFTSFRALVQRLRKAKK